MAFNYSPMIVVLAVAISLALQASSFSPNTTPSCHKHLHIIHTSSSSSISKLFSLIKGEAQGSEPFDENEGGVGLARRTAVKITGVSKKDDGGSDAQELVRYDQMREIDDSSAKSMLEKSNCQLLCSGEGKEMYQDPGSSIDTEGKVIKLAPLEAASNALSSVASSVTIGEDAKSIVLNFLGGDDLIIGEVFQACDMLVEGLDFPSKTKVTFNSVSLEDFPSDECAVTVVASSMQTGGLEGVDAGVAKGELYIHEGKWFTMSEGDITTATK